MAVKWEKKEGNTGVLTIEVEPAKFEVSLDKAFKKVVSKMNVPGFRKGKMPRVLFEKQYGVESLYNEALDLIVPEVYASAVKEAGIEVIAPPEIDVKEIGKGKTLIIEAIVMLKPEVKLGEYKIIEVERMSVEVTDEDITEELETLQGQHAELVVKEGTVELGDTVVIDFDGYVNDVAFEGGKAENYSLEIGSGSFIPGFEDQVVGMETGNEKDIQVTFPEEYHAPNLAGQPAVFKIKLHEIKSKQLPEIDDEFAKDTDDTIESLDELKEKIRTRLEVSKKEEAEQLFEQDVLEAVANNAEVEIPEVMIESETDRMVSDFGRRMSGQGLSLEMYFQFSGQTKEQLREQMKNEAEQRVRTTLVLEEVAKAEDMQVSDEEMDTELEKMATMYQMTVEDLRKAIGSIEGLRSDLVLRKTAEFLFAQVK